MTLFFENMMYGANERELVCMNKIIMEQVPTYALNRYQPSLQYLGMHSEWMQLEVISRMRRFKVRQSMIVFPCSLYFPFGFTGRVLEPVWYSSGQVTNLSHMTHIYTLPLTCHIFGLNQEPSTSQPSALRNTLYGGILS